MWGWILKGLAATGVLGLFGITLDQSTKSVVKAATALVVVYLVLQKVKFK